MNKKNRIEVEKQVFNEAFRELERRLNPKGLKYKAGSE
jgi:hypothetical protein